MTGSGSNIMDHIGRLSQGLGWWLQRPTRLAVERNRAKTRRWVKIDTRSSV